MESKRFTACLQAKGCSAKSRCWYSWLSSHRYQRAGGALVEFLNSIFIVNFGGEQAFGVQIAIL